MNSNLDPIRILLRKAQDQSLVMEGVLTLLHAASYLDDTAYEEKIALWIEGRL